MSKPRVFSCGGQTCKANFDFGFLTSGQFSVRGELEPSSTVERARGFWSTAILAVGPAGILSAAGQTRCGEPAGSRLAGETPASPTGWKPAPRRIWATDATKQTRRPEAA